MNGVQDDRAIAARTDYALHGLVGVRLLNASPSDAAAVARQLGPLPSSLDREPDIVIRFVDRLTISSRVRYLGLDEAGFTDDAFLVLRSRHKAPARVQIPFERIGNKCEIVCESGLPAVPLLIPVVNLTVLAKGAIPLHASAFSYNGTGVLVTGWSKGGKTETLLAFMARGARYIGDEWVYISGDGHRMFGIPEPLRLWSWHFDDVPQYRRRVSLRDRVRLRAIESARLLSRVVPNSKLVRRVRAILKRQAFVDLHPEDLFSRQLGTLAGNVDKVLFAVSHDTPDVLVQAVDPEEVARRMVFSLQHERLDFMSYYLKFRFAFPAAANELIERAETLEREGLTRALAGKDTFCVSHPYPVSLDALFQAVSPLL
jgi:hypothetical protein